MKSVTNLRGMIFTKDCVFEPGELVIEDGIIKEIRMCEYEDLVQKEQKKYLIPGFVDMHFHGATGYDFCDGTKEALQAIATYENRHGITTICPATMSLPVLELERILAVAVEWKTGQDAKHKEVCENYVGCEKTKQEEEQMLVHSLRGIHLEGPFLSREKKGAQKEDHIIPADKDVLRNLQEKANGLIKLVTIAPETEGAMECIEALKDELHFSLGHTMADYETACKAFEAGADHVTHLYNAMKTSTHREPSVPEAAADNDNVFVELICDGIHVHPSVVRNAFRIYGDDRIVLISDSMRATGMPDGEYTLGGQKVIVKGARAILADETMDSTTQTDVSYTEKAIETDTIAGSVTNLYECMKKAISMGIPKESAIKAATINPARSIGVDKEVGSLEVGKRADILIVDENLTLEMVILGGNSYK